MNKPAPRFLFQLLPLLLALAAATGYVVLNSASWGRYAVPTAEVSDQETVSPEGLVWDTYSYSDYQFEYPSNWEVKVIDGRPGNYTARFYNEAGYWVATLRCPIPESGWEAWTFTREDRQLTKNGTIYGVDLWRGVLKEDPQAPPLFMVFMHLNDFAHWGGDTWEDYLNSCLLEIRSEVEEDIARSVYGSVR